MLTWQDNEISTHDTLANYRIIRRNGAIVSFDIGKSALAFAGAVLVAHRLKKSIPALDGLRSYSRQRLGMINLKQAFNGFFSASKANLRNAP